MHAKARRRGGNRIRSEFQHSAEEPKAGKANAMRGQPSFGRGTLGFFAAYLVAVVTFVSLTGHQSWEAGAMSSVPEPERTRQFWVMQELSAAAIFFVSFAPVLAFHLLGVGLQQRRGWKIQFSSSLLLQRLA
jgi:hypothetical protein